MMPQIVTGCIQTNAERSPPERAPVDGATQGRSGCRGEHEPVSPDRELFEVRSKYVSDVLRERHCSIRRVSLHWPEADFAALGRDVSFGAGSRIVKPPRSHRFEKLLCGTPGGIAVPAPGSVRKGGWTAPEICEGFVSCRATDSCCRAGFRVEVRP